MLSYNGTTWSNIQQTPSTYPFSVLQPLSQKGQAGGYCGLDSWGKIPFISIDIGLSSCEKLAIKNQTSGYAGLDSIVKF